MYRPTVRYAEVFREYVDDLFHATHLDRNQILRASLFVAPYSKEFHSLLGTYQKQDVPLPSPSWQLHESGFWLKQNERGGEGREDANGKKGPIPAEKREVIGERIRSVNGGITYRLG